MNAAERARARVTSQATSEAEQDALDAEGDLESPADSEVWEDSEAEEDSATDPEAGEGPRKPLESTRCTLLTVENACNVDLNRL